MAIVKLEHWLEKRYCDSSPLAKLSKEFVSNKPFPHLVLPDFLQLDKVADLLEALSKEEFYEKNSDLFSLKQTNDLLGSKHRVLQEFRSLLLSESFLLLLEKITGLTLKRGVLDLQGSLYEDTDYLLCHDDQLEGRALAFIYYLSDFEEADGGSLNLFASHKGIPTNVVKKIVPRMNTLAFFKVTPLSFHEVEEVVADKQRIALGGWFHG